MNEAERRAASAWDRLTPFEREQMRTSAVVAVILDAARPALRREWEEERREDEPERVVTGSRSKMEAAVGEKWLLGVGVPARRFGIYVFKGSEEGAEENLARNALPALGSIALKAQVDDVEACRALLDEFSADEKTRDLLRREVLGW